MLPEVYLTDHRYQLDETLDHRELLNFVASYIYKKNPVMSAFWWLTLLFLVALVYHSVNLLIANIGSFSDIMLNFFYGLGCSMLLIPFHELLHGAAYNLCGATTVQYKANWRKLYFMAVADKFITTRTQFYFIGLTPFITISIIMVIFSIYATAEWRVTWLSVLFIHTTMCIGDFGLMSYFAENSNKDVVTFDDVQKETSYFYSRELETKEKAN